MHPMYKKAIWCKINDEHLSELANRVPQPVLNGLKTLKGQKFATEDDFLGALGKEINNPDLLNKHKDKLPTSGLWQGDIIDRGKLIRQSALMGHQDYIASRTDFCGFCVVSQTCDLVCGRCIDFITLAVIRKVADVIPAKDDELVKLINHRSDPKDGYFYLFRDEKLGINDDAVVDLRTMFSLHNKHYQQLLRARTVSLSELYATKLGWIASYLFSRVALPEWHEHREMTGEDQADVVNRMKAAIKKRVGTRLSNEKPHFGVALIEDLPANGLSRGQVGTVVEELPAGCCRVDFYDDKGIYVTLELNPRQFVKLQYQRAGDIVKSATT